MGYNLLPVKLIPFHMGEVRGGRGSWLSGGTRERVRDRVNEKLETVREGRDRGRIAKRADGKSGGENYSIA